MPFGGGAIELLGEGGGEGGVSRRHQVWLVDSMAGGTVEFVGFESRISVGWCSEEMASSGLVDLILLGIVQSGGEYFAAF